MAEAGAHKLTMTAEELKEELVIYGPINVAEAKEYTNSLEKIVDNLGDLLQEGKDEALEMTIKEVKNYMIKTWLTWQEQMLALWHCDVFY